MAYKLSAALSKSIVPEIGPNPTSMTRALSAYFGDWEGLLRLAPANCARFTGARFVRNLALNSCFAGTPGGVNTRPTSWNTMGSQGNCSQLVAEAGPNGAVGVVRLRRIATTGYEGIGYSFVMELNSAYRISVNIRIPTGVTAADCIMYVGAATPSTFTVASAATLNAQPKDVWVRYSVLGTVTAGTPTSFSFCMNTAAIGTGFDFTEPQLELVAGQSNQNPSEVILTGLLAFPYHGAGADGCKFFDTQNGNTVAANVVTEAAGAAISVATLKKYRKEIAATNLLPQSAFASGWTAAGNATLTPNFAVGPDGGLNALKCEENSTASSPTTFNESVATSVVSGTIYCLSVYTKKVDRQYVFMLFGPNFAVNDAKYFDLTNGTFGSTMGTGVLSFGIEALPGGWFRCWATSTATGTGTLQPSFGITTLNAVQTHTGVVGSHNLFWGAQFEAGSYPTSPIPTTTVAVTRPEDMLIWPASVISDTAGTAYAEYEADSWPAAAVWMGIIGGTSVPAVLVANSNNGGVLALDGTTAAYGPAGTPSGTVRGASHWGDGTMRTFAAGVAGPSYAYDGGFALSNVYIGRRGGGYFQGHIGNVQIHDVKLSSFDVPLLPNYTYPFVVPTALEAYVGRPAQPPIGAYVAPQLAVLVGSVQQSQPFGGS